MEGNIFRLIPFSAIFIIIQFYRCGVCATICTNCTLENQNDFNVARIKREVNISTSFGQNINGSMVLPLPTGQDDIGSRKINTKNINKEEILKFLTDISDSKVISGLYIHSTKLSVNALATIQTTAGVLPGILVSEIPKYSDGVTIWQSFVNTTISNWNNGHLVYISWEMTDNPLVNMKNWTGDDTINDAQWNDLISEGGQLNQKWKKQLDTLVPYLNEFQNAGVVLFCDLFPDINLLRDSMLWSGRPGVNGSSKLFQITHNYLTYQKNLHSLIWVWSITSEENWDTTHLKDFWPGNEFVDVVSVDMNTNKELESDAYDNILELAGNKPISMEEMEYVPSPEILTRFRLNWFTACGDTVGDSEFNNQSTINTTFNNPIVLNVGDKGFFQIKKEFTTTEPITAEPTTTEPTTTRPTTSEPTTTAPTTTEPATTEPTTTQSNTTEASTTQSITTEATNTQSTTTEATPTQSITTEATNTQSTTTEATNTQSTTTEATNTQSTTTEPTTTQSTTTEATTTQSITTEATTTEATTTEATNTQSTTTEPTTTQSTTTEATTTQSITTEATTTEATNTQSTTTEATTTQSTTTEPTTTQSTTTEASTTQSTTTEASTTQSITTEASTTQSITTEASTTQSITTEATTTEATTTQSTTTEPTTTQSTTTEATNTQSTTTEATPTQSITTEATTTEATNTLSTTTEPTTTQSTTTEATTTEPTTTQSTTTELTTTQSKTTTPTITNRATFSKDDINITKTEAKAQFYNNLRRPNCSTTDSGLSITNTGSERNDGLKVIQRIAGVLPGVLTTRMPKYSAGKKLWQSFVTETISNWNENYLVHIRWDKPANPLTSMKIFKERSPSNWNDLLTPEGTLHETWKTELDKLVPYLKQLESAGVITIFNILPYMNVISGLWNGRPGSNGSLKLYQMTHNYLTQHHKLKSLFWVWSVDARGDMAALKDYWPGNKCVDVVEVFMSTTKQLSDPWYKQLLDVVDDKPIFMEGMFYVPSPKHLAVQCRWSWFTVLDITLEHESFNTEREINAAFNGPSVINNMLNKSGKTRY